MCMCSNYAVDFVGNTIVNVQQSPFTVTSAAQVTIQNTTFINVLCHDKDVQAFTWAAPGSLIAMANVENVSISGTHIHTNRLCKSPSGDHARPVFMVNATNVQGVLPIGSPAPSLLQEDQDR